MCEVIAVAFVWQSLVPALSSVLRVELHTERGWFLPTGPVKSSVSLCDGSIHHIYTYLIVSKRVKVIFTHCIFILRVGQD